MISTTGDKTVVYELTETYRAEKLFGNWEETMIYSCLQKVMGKLYVADGDSGDDNSADNAPKSVMALLGDFLFLAGEPCRELVMNKPDGFIIMVPQTEEWTEMIRECFLENSKQVTRYAMKKDTVFDKGYLAGLVRELPKGYAIQLIDSELYDQCKENEWSKDFVSVFESKEAYLQSGLGAVITKNGEIIAGASSYTRYQGGIEIEVDTRVDERRKHLALVCCARLILECLERNLYPSWDAQNLGSVHLAEKLGYEFSHEYVAFEVK